MRSVVGILGPAMTRPTASMQILAPGAIAAPVWEEMWQLTCRFYQAERAYVEAKLRGHDRLALFRSDADGSLIGMAAIQVEPMEFGGRKLLVIFTSHAIMDERYRGQNLIQRAGVHTWLRSLLRHPLRRKLWTFDTFSYKSYLMLARNLVEFWPRHDRATPAWEAAFMQHYGQLKYGDAWHGAVVERSPQKRLLPQTAAWTPELLQDPNLAFYARMNPGHAEGDMMLCLVPLSFGNWWGIVSHAVRRGLRRRAGS